MPTAMYSVYATGGLHVTVSRMPVLQLYESSSVGQHLSHWPTIKTLSPVHEKLLAELALKFSGVNHLFRSFNFRDFLEKHLYFFILYLIGISKYSQNASRQYQTLFYFLINHNIR